MCNTTFNLTSVAKTNNGSVWEITSRHRFTADQMYVQCRYIKTELNIRDLTDQLMMIGLHYDFCLNSKYVKQYVLCKRANI